MVFVPFPDGAKAAIAFDWNGIEVSVILHFEKTSPPAGSFPALAAEVAAAYASDLMPNFSNDLVMGDVTVYDLSAEFAPKVVNSDQNGTAGTKTGDSVPNNAAVLISHRTTQTGRSGRGRSYIPGLVETEESDGLLNSGPRDAILTSWGTFITGITALGWTFVVAQRILDGLPLAVGIMRPVVTEILKLQLGTQRRRQVLSAV